MEERKKDFIDLKAITERLLIIREGFDGNDKEFSIKTGISPSRFSEVRNGKKPTISLSDVNEIIRKCPDLVPSAEYFVFGRSLSPIPNAEEIDLFNQQEADKQNFLANRIEALATENANLKNEKEALEIKLKEAEKKPKLVKEISEIKVYYTNNSFETYKTENELLNLSED